MAPFANPLLSLVLLYTWIIGPTSAVPAPADPCAAIAGQTFVPPANARACLKSFPFNETLRQNVLQVASRVFDFYSFEDYYLDSPWPFQESTVDIRAKLAELNSTTYQTDYDFNVALYDFTNQLNDGHTRWFPNCYTSFQNILPAPVISVEVDGQEGLYIAFDSVEFITQLGPSFAGYFDSIGFDWKRLTGAKILEIEGQDPYNYVDHIASTVTGNYLDHGVRVNSVLSSYRIQGTSFSQRLGDLAGPTGVAKNSLTFKLTTANSTTAETLTIPYVASYGGIPFTDSNSYWQANCAANNKTNGVDLKNTKMPTSRRDARRLKKSKIIDKLDSSAVGLPSQYLPTVAPVNGSEAVIKSYILPDNITGVMFVGSFEPDDFDAFQRDVVSAVTAFKAANVSRLLIDLTNNGGGYICLGHFLHHYLAGSSIGNPGFASTARANPLAQKIMAADIKLGLNDSFSQFSADNWAFLNNTQMPLTHNYFTPPLPFTVNGRSDPTSERFFDACLPSYSQPIPDKPPFDLRKVAIVSNGICASTCALFSTAMYERHLTPIAIFGGRPGQSIQYKGMAGNEVLEWTDLDTEIKTSGLKDDPLAPPDLLVAGNMRVNWRTAWSWWNPLEPIAYLFEPPFYRFPYTKDTYNNPQNLWTFAAQQLFKF